MKLADISHIESLSNTEKVRLVDELWDSITKPANVSGIPDWHEQALAADVADYMANPDTGSSWSDVKRRITNQP